jgi:catechol 2,3-dioxygenase-like lactoylglutathione lyase family enzyme
MLANHPIDVMILATDLGVAREFYSDRIGLEVLLESDDFLTFRCGGDSRLVVTRSSSGTSEPQTKASWRVDDLAAEVAELRSRGVQVEEYDEPGLKTVDGIAELGGIRGAWFKDPEGNILSVVQLPAA